MLSQKSELPLCECGCKKHVTKKHNRFIRGHNMFGVTPSEKTKKKMSLSHMGHVATKETREKMSLFHMGRVATKETRKKISEGQLGEKNHNYGKHLTKKIKQKISEANSGKVMSDEARKKMSEGHMGLPSYWKDKHFTKAHRKKISDMMLGERNHNYGKHLTEATKCKISLSHRDTDFYNEYGCLKSNYPYNDCFTNEFKNIVRSRDGNRCVVTGMTNEEHKTKYGRSLCVHHWTYDKNVTDPFYFVTVTCGINIAAETNRGEWIDMFNEIMEDKYCEIIKK